MAVIALAMLRAGAFSATCSTAATASRSPPPSADVGRVTSTTADRQPDTCTGVRSALAAPSRQQVGGDRAGPS